MPIILRCPHRRTHRLCCRYYIVQQGKVNALALMKDDDRLQLLKEVAGTRVYEERRQESLKIIQVLSTLTYFRIIYQVSVGRS